MEELGICLQTFQKEEIVGKQNKMLSTKKNKNIQEKTVNTDSQKKKCNLQKCLEFKNLTTFLLEIKKKFQKFCLVLQKLPTG